MGVWAPHWSRSSMSPVWLSRYMAWSWLPAPTLSPFFGSVLLLVQFGFIHPWSSCLSFLSGAIIGLLYLAKLALPCQGLSQEWELAGSYVHTPSLSYCHALFFFNLIKNFKTWWNICHKIWYLTILNAVNTWGTGYAVQSPAPCICRSSSSSRAEALHSPPPRLSSCFLFPVDCPWHHIQVWSVTRLAFLRMAYFTWHDPFKMDYIVCARPLPF